MQASEPKLSVTIDLPEGAAEVFGRDPEIAGRRIFESAVAEAYRRAKIGRGQVSQILGLSWPKTEEFLAQHNCDRHYDLEELEEDRRSAREIFKR
jgi:predicted HTH domain antitoxin